MCVAAGTLVLWARGEMGAADSGLLGVWFPGLTGLVLAAYLLPSEDDRLLWLTVAVVAVAIVLGVRAGVMMPLFCTIGVAAFALPTPRAVPLVLVSVFSAVLGDVVYETRPVAVMDLRMAMGALPTMFAGAMGWFLRTNRLARVRAETLAETQRKLNDVLELQLSRAGQLASARERTRIARELHDCVGHYFTTTLLYLELARRHARADQTEVLEAIDKSRHTNQRALDELRRCVEVLRESSGPRDLAASLRALARDLPLESLSIDVVVEGEERRLDAGREFAIFRAAQEGITNVLRHANASEISVVLSYGADRVELSVCDDGTWRTERGSGVGLRGLRERLEPLGGALRVGPRPDARGTILVATV